jgi:hypothetical protein
MIKIEITTITGMTSKTSCKAIEVKDGFLKIINDHETDKTLETEVWLPCARIGTIEVSKEKIVP